MEKHEFAKNKRKVNYLELELSRNSVIQNEIVSPANFQNLLYTKITESRETFEQTWVCLC